MGMAVGPKKGSVKNDINVTPLVDVVLVLLIIFMVITPMLQRGKDVKLPQSKSIDEENKESDPIILSVTKDKHIFIESSEYDKEGFSPALKVVLDEKPGRKILLKGDDSLTVGDVREVMEMSRKAGAKSVALGVEEQK
ncbi:ExbD/TolR family protein [Polyangium jinanense]|uniref:Biopolymer transporter ExbD n=1 Tax=Polyangium jinanense TaxID=2829994 RepID=A0A9X4AWQ4_9BACT|nr:biopolymer transporter ExbD [Polyangium jinanense]MDC3956650.1 biopolymer transporter ExbD [Polyangium jinanense]MDC3985567.1 biopolymer transporter ExbD [Polyangium jinanense]